MPHRREHDTIREIRKENASIPSFRTITSKMQLTLPIALYRELGLKPGDKVLVEEREGRIHLTPARTAVEELAGSLEPQEDLIHALDQKEASR